MRVDKKVKEFYGSDFDEMVDDIYDQIDPAEQEAVFDQSEDFVEPETGSLEDFKEYDMTDKEEEDFSDTYRTPDFVFEEGPKKAEMLIGTVLPEEITVTDNIDDYLDEKDARYPGILKMHPGRMEYEDLEKNKTYNKKVKSGKRGSPALYDTIFHEEIVRKDIVERNNIPEFVDILTHEHIHNLEKEIAYRKPMPRVRSEPNTEMFKEMSENNVIRQDWGKFLQRKPIPSKNKKQRQQFIDNRREISNSFENDYAFAEQMAYFGEHTRSKSIRNPKTQTERVLHRMWFQ